MKTMTLAAAEFRTDQHIWHRFRRYDSAVLGNVLGETVLFSRLFGWKLKPSRISQFSLVHRAHLHLLLSCLAFGASMCLLAQLLGSVAATAAVRYNLGKAAAAVWCKLVWERKCCVVFGSAANWLLYQLERFKWDSSSSQHLHFSIIKAAVWLSVQMQ